MNTGQIESNLLAIKFLKHIYRSPIDYHNAMCDIWDSDDMEVALIRIINDFTGKEKVSTMLIDLLMPSWEEIKEELRLTYRDFVKSYPDVIGEWEMDKQEEELKCKRISNCI